MAVKNYANADIKVYFVQNILSKIVSSLPFRNKILVVVIKYYTKADIKLASFFYFVLNIFSATADIEEKVFH